MARNSTVQQKQLIVHPRFAVAAAPCPPASCTNLNCLPNEVLHCIASFVTSAADLCSLELVSRRCRVAAEDDQIWKRLCQEKFCAARGCAPPSWKQLYRFNHEVFYQIVMAKPTEGARRLGPTLPSAAGPFHFNLPVFG